MLPMLSRIYCLSFAQSVPCFRFPDQFLFCHDDTAIQPPQPTISLPESIDDNPHCAVLPGSDLSRTDSENLPDSGHIPTYGRSPHLPCPTVLTAMFHSLPDIPPTQAIPCRTQNLFRNNAATSHTVQIPNTANPASTREEFTPKRNT